MIDNQPNAKRSLNHHFIPHDNISSRLIIINILNIRAKMINLTEENIGENLSDLELRKNFLKSTLKSNT